MRIMCYNHHKTKKRRRNDKFDFDNEMSGAQRDDDAAEGEG